MWISTEHVHGIRQQGFIVKPESLFLAPLTKIPAKSDDGLNRVSMHNEESAIHVDDRSGSHPASSHQFNKLIVWATPPILPQILGRAKVALQGDVNWGTMRHGERVAGIAHEICVHVQPHEIIVIQLLNMVAKKPQLKQTPPFFEIAGVMTNCSLNSPVGPNVKVPLR